MVRNPLRRILRLGPRGRESFSQSGEDMIARYVFDVLGVAEPSYLDIGAHHPFELSNTAAFYKAGSRGVTVEPEIVYHQLLQRYRPGDVNLHAGVGPTSGTMPFYALSLPTLSTFKRAEMEGHVENGVELVQEVRIPVLTADAVIDRHFNGRAPDLLSLDTEGQDAEILRSVDYAKHAPLVVCAENSTSGVADCLGERGYRLYAQTLINLIFVREDGWAELERRAIPRISR